MPLFSSYASERGEAGAKRFGKLRGEQVDDVADPSHVSQFYVGKARKWRLSTSGTGQFRVAGLEIGFTNRVSARAFITFPITFPIQLFAENHLRSALRAGLTVFVFFSV